MTISWDDYRPFEWPFEPRARLGKRFNELSREAAVTLFERIVSAKDQRKRLLANLLGTNGLEQPFELSQVNKWYCEKVESAPDAPFDLRPIWYTVSLDIALFLGDRIREHAPNLEWSLCTSPPNGMTYHMPVLAGFEDVENENYHYDVLSGVAVVAREELLLRNPEAKVESADSPLEKRMFEDRLHRLKDREPEHAEQAFQDMVNTCLEMA
jgi:hypothetical protein